MPNARHFDLAAEEAKPITFSYKGEVYRLRGHTPALPVLHGMRAKLDGTEDEDVSEAYALEFLGAIFEDGELDRILRTGISQDKLFEIVRRAGAILRSEADEGEAMPPTTGASTVPAASSNGSTSSRRTSNGSTRSTSGQRSVKG